MLNEFVSALNASQGNPDRLEKVVLSRFEKSIVEDKSLKQFVRWGMSEFVNQKNSVTPQDVQTLFNSFCLGIARTEPSLANNVAENLGFAFASGLMLSYRQEKSVFDILGGVSEVLPSLEKMPFRIRRGMQVMMAQDYNTLGASKKRTSGVVLLRDWLERDGEACSYISPLSVFSRMSDTQIPEDPHVYKAIAAIATKLLDVQLPDKFTLHLAKTSDNDVSTFVAGLVTLYRDHDWRVSDLSVVRNLDKKSISRLEKVLLRAQSKWSLKKQAPPLEEISAILSEVRRFGLQQYIVPHTENTTKSNKPKI